MKRIALLTVLAAVVATAGAGQLTASARPTRGDDVVAKVQFKVVPVKTGLDDPAGFTFLPNGRILYGERGTGRVIELNPKTGKSKVVYTISHVRSNGEQGLLGLAVDPHWPDKPFIYAYATRQLKSLQNQILKIKMTGSHGVSQRVIWRLGTTAGTYHDGGHITFGPDGKLYVVVGEGHNSANAQDLTIDAGKVLRMNPNGSAPKDNPFPGSVIYSYGLRNSFGFAFDPESGTLWETENGPECNDEINVEKAGENHAWGSHETCSGDSPQNTNQDGPDPRIMPLAWFTPTIAPTGLAFCEGCGIKKADGTLFFGAYNTGEIRQVTLTGDREGIKSMKVVYDFAGGVMSMQAAPDGGLYFSSSDAIYQLVQG